MPHYSNQQIIELIQNGEEEVLFYLTKKYFQTARKWLRRNGCRDAETPSVFSSVLIEACREIQQKNISQNIDFESYFFNTLRENFNLIKSNRNPIENFDISDEKKIIGSCFSILDENYRSILSARFVEKLSFEQIAARMNFSNPIIAQFEFNKAFLQFEKITRARLNVNYSG